MTDRNEALRLADELDRQWRDDALNYDTEMEAAALLRQQAERIAELEAEVQEQARLNGMGAERELALIAERDQLRAEVERYRHLRNGQSWPAVFASHDAPEPLRGDDLDTALDHARTTHKDEG